jgi:capsular exopolysaccharide synthesis family protein
MHSNRALTQFDPTAGLIEARAASAIQPMGISDSSGYATFGGLAALLWRNRWTLALFVEAGLVLAVVLCATQTPVFQARTSVEIRMPNEDYLNRRQLNPVVEPGMLLMEPFLQTQVKLIQSDQLLERVTGRFRLAELPEFNSSWGFPARLIRRGLGKTTLPPTQAALLESVHRRLLVRMSGQTQIMEILFESSDPKLAASFVNGLAEEYRAQCLERMVSSSTQTADLLSGQIADLRTGLELAEKNLRDYLARNGPVAASDKETLAETQLRLTQAALSAAHDARVAEQSRYEMVRNASPDSLVKMLDSDTLKSYRVKLADLRQQLAEASAIYKPAHFKVRQIQAEIDDIEFAFQRERTGIQARLRNQYEAAQFREDSLRREYEKEFSLAGDQMGQSIQVTALRRDLDLRRQLYESMVQKVKDAGVASAMQASNIQVIDPARPPERPVRPKKFLYAAIGILAGLFNGLVFVSIAERRRMVSALRRPMQPAARDDLSLDTPRLGTIPSLALDAASPPMALGGADRPSRPLSLTRGNPGTYPVPELTVWHDSGSEFAKSFDAVLPSLLLGTRQYGLPRVIAVTSACHGEGRTLVSCNLAAALAQTGRNVLLIDADPIHPRLHDIFRLPNDKGLADLIAQPPRGDSWLADSVWMTDMAGLYVLPAGRNADRLATLAGDPRTSDFFDRLCRDFDAILIDSPPVLSPAHAQGLACQTDGVVFVVGANHASDQLAASAIQRLSSGGVPVIGKIVNHHRVARSTAAR